MGKYGMPNMGGNTFSNKLTSFLLKEMTEGEYKDSTKLPSEVELTQKYAVSRSVVRDALAALEREGFVERGRGIGTVIHRNVVAIQNRMDIKHEYLNLVLSMGHTPKTSNVKLYCKTAGEKVAKKLQIQPEEEILVCEKIILADDVPVIYSIDNLPKALFAGKDYQMINWNAPVFDILEERLGINVDTDITNLSATNGTPQIRGKLKIKPEEALLLMDEVGYYKLSFPILHSYGYYTSFFDFSLLRKRV